MPEPSGSPVGAEPSPAKQSGKEKKRKDKVRSAWISFTGRIVAQVLGASASIILGVIVLQKYQSSSTKGGERTGTTTKAGAPAVRASATRAGEVALVVLPLQNISADAKQDYFADGMTEALITDLARIEGLDVISRTSSMHYKGQNKPLPEIAWELGVNWIIEGSVQKAGDRVRVTAQLIDASTDKHVWAKSYDRTVRDVLALQAELSAAIAGEVKVALKPQRQERAAQRRAVDPEVYDIYLQGRQAESQWTTAGFQQAVRYFEKAIQKDPDFALAHAAISDAYSLLGTSGYATPEVPDAMARAKKAAERALALDDSLAEVHTALGRVHHYYDWDWAAAERSFRRAIELNPGYATAHRWYATFLSEQGRDPEALLEANRAVALDPLSANKYITLASVHLNARRYDLAMSAARRAQELDEKALAPTLIMSSVFLAQGKARAAIELCERSKAARHPLVLGMLSSAYTRAGEVQRGSAIRQQLLATPKVPASALVRLHAGSGDHDALFRTLDRAVAERSDIIPRLRVSPLFDSVRSDPRFADLLKRVRLS